MSARFRVHTDGRVAVRPPSPTDDRCWLVLELDEPVPGAWWAWDEVVHGEGWSEAVLVVLPPGRTADPECPDVVTFDSRVDLDMADGERVITDGAGETYTPDAIADVVTTSREVLDPDAAAVTRVADAIDAALALGREVLNPKAGA